MAAKQVNLCMIDNQGRQVTEWLPHMQSSGMLREMIAKDVRTSECWAELKRRQERGHATQRAIDALKARRGPSSNN